MIMISLNEYLGGAQHNIGIFIHKITPNSKAEELGLQVNDIIIKSARWRFHTGGIFFVQFIQPQKRIQIQIRFEACSEK